MSPMTFSLHVGQNTRGSISLPPADEEAIDLPAMVLM